MAEIVAQFLKLSLSEDEMYTNMNVYVSENAEFSTEFVYKEPTSFFNPTLIIEHDFLATAQCNYVAIYSPGALNYTYYFIEDVVTTSHGICEVQCKFDAFRTVPWRNMDTKIQLRYSTNESHWSTTCEEIRFEPYAPFCKNAQITRGYRRLTESTGISAALDGTNDISVSDYSSVNTSVGVYLVKWLWGDASRNLGYCYGMFNAEQFTKFIGDVTNFIANNPGALFGGVLNYNQMILSCKYFPSLHLKQAAASADYVYIDGVGFGGLGSSEAWCYIRENNAGFIENLETCGWNTLFPLGKTTASNIDTLKKMKFLLNPKWCKIVVDTPIGIGELSLDATDAQESYYGATTTEIAIKSIIDLENGTLKMDFETSYRDGFRGSPNILLTLRGPISLDISDRTWKIQSTGEMLMQQAISGNLIGNVMGGAGIGSGAGSVAAAGPAGAILGAATGFAKTLATPRQIHMPSARNDNDLSYLAAWGYSIAQYTITSTIFLNYETPITDTTTYSASGSWDAMNVYNNYTSWCKEIYHGFPSMRYITCSGIGPYQSNQTPLYIQAQRILDINVYDFPHWCEDIIKQKLLNGVVLKYYNSTST